jgi:hypothetical protein
LPMPTAPAVELGPLAIAELSVPIAYAKEFTPDEAQLFPPLPVETVLPLYDAHAPTPALAAPAPNAVALTNAPVAAAPNRKTPTLLWVRRPPSFIAVLIMFSLPCFPSEAGDSIPYHKLVAHSTAKG